MPPLWTPPDIKLWQGRAVGCISHKFKNKNRIVLYNVQYTVPYTDYNTLHLSVKNTNYKMLFRQSLT